MCFSSKGFDRRSSGYDIGGFGSHGNSPTMDTGQLSTSRRGKRTDYVSHKQLAKLNEDGGFDSAKVDIPLISTGH